ncbi:MAG: glycosyltransferase family 2 protein [Proteobacteria bacterium]|nr:glycosyltransferase family 2 protein [Pseudomonadota bacterium]
MGSYRVGFVIPALNEEDTVGAVVRGLNGRGVIIVVDDGSSDNTALCASNAGAHVVRHVASRGYEGALNTGIETAFVSHGVDGVITLDADGEHDLSSVDEFVRALQGQKYALVLGARDRKNRVVEKLAGLIFLVRYGVRDIFCGMKGYQAYVWKARQVFDSTQSVGTELALCCLRARLPFCEVKVRSPKRLGPSKYGARSILANLRMLGGILRALRIKPINTDLH